MSHLTKKDYELIATSIWRCSYIKDGNAVKQQAKDDMRRLIALDLAGSFIGENSKFNADKFLKACGVTND